MNWLRPTISRGVQLVRSIVAMAIEGSAQFFTTTLTASVTNQLLANEPIARISVDSDVSIRYDTTGATNTVLSTIASDTRIIQRESPIPVGATAGVIPNAQDNPGVSFVAFAGETLTVSARETAAATPVVNMMIEVVPL